MLVNSQSLESNNSLPQENTLDQTNFLESERLSFEEGSKILEKILEKVKDQIGLEAYSSWFGRLKLSSYSPTVVKLSVPTSFLRSWILNHYSGLLTELWQKEVPSILRIDVLVRSATRPANVAQKKDKILPLNYASKAHHSDSLKSDSFSNDARNRFDGSPLDLRYHFDNFVEGASNRMVFAAAKTIAETAPGHARFNPLFIHAGVGLGKTHLLQAIASAALKRPSNPRVVYLTAEYFMWRFATAIRDNDALSLKEQLRDIDFLIIDDLQFLQGKSIQREFCHLLNLLLDSAKQVVVAADRPPSELESLDMRVRSRLQSGVSLKIEDPDYNMRLEMLRQKAKDFSKNDSSVSVPDEALVYVAQSICGSGRDIEGALNQLLFRQSFEADLSFPRIDEILGHLTRPGAQKRIKIEEIQKVVSRHYNVSKQDLLSTRRTRMIVKPRQVAMYLAKVLTPRSLPEIGRRFGGRDHTTVLHAIRKIEDLIGKDKNLDHELELLKRLINEQA